MWQQEKRDIEWEVKHFGSDTGFADLCLWIVGAGVAGAAICILGIIILKLCVI